MSDNLIKLIPEDPLYIPDIDRQSAVLRWLQKLAPTADEIEVKVSDEVVFHDCGTNFESVACPSCETDIVMEWWQEWMEQDYGENSFSLSLRALPCCGHSTNLQQLRYDLPQGFSKWSIEPINPNIAEIRKKDLKRIEEAIGCALRVIYQRL